MRVHHRGGGVADGHGAAQDARPDGPGNHQTALRLLHLGAGHQPVSLEDTVKALEGKESGMIA